MACVRNIIWAARELRGVLGSVLGVFVSVRILCASPLVSLVLCLTGTSHALSRFFNILRLLTCRLIRIKSAEMPPKVIPLFSQDADHCLTRLGRAPRCLKEETGPARRSCCGNLVENDTPFYA